MVDNYRTIGLGANVEGYGATILVEVAAAQTIAAGDALKLTSTNQGFYTVSQAVAGDKARLVAMEGGSAGARIRALRNGKVKVTFGGAVSLNAAVKAGASARFVSAVLTVTIPSGATAVTSTSAQPSMTVEDGVACGICLQTIAANGDTGIMWFNGDLF